MVKILLGTREQKELNKAANNGTKAVLLLFKGTPKLKKKKLLGNIEEHEGNFVGNKKPSRALRLGRL